MTAQLTLERGRKMHDIDVKFWVRAGEPRTWNHPGVPDSLEDVKVLIGRYNVTRCLTKDEVLLVYRACWEHIRRYGYE